MNKFLYSILAWRLRHISNQNLIIVLSLVIGVISGLVAVILKTLLFYIHELIIQLPTDLRNSFYFVIPPVGILLTVIYRMLVLKGVAWMRIPSLLHVIAKKSGLISRAKMYSHVIGSGLTVGFGGSAGLEAPIVATGAAWGSNLALLFHLGYKKRLLLIGCGVAGAMSAIFNSPVAAVIFTLEILLLRMTIPAFIPILISAVTGTLVSKTILGNGILFNFSQSDPFHVQEVPYFILLGIFTGFLAVYFSRTAFSLEKIINRIKNPYKKALFGGVALGILVFIFPAFYGEGYLAIKNLLAGDIESFKGNHILFEKLDTHFTLLIFTAFILLLKVVATIITIGAGGNAGVFAPTMFTGAVGGFFLATLLNLLPFGAELSEKNFVLTGMAGLMAGLLHAPLTAIFLIAEITNGYGLLVPLIIVSAISYATSSRFEPHSYYIKRLTQKKLFTPDNKDKVVLTFMKLNKLLEKDFVPLKFEHTLRDVVEAVKKSKRNLFPVLDDENHLLGVIVLDDVREIMFKPDFYNKVFVKDVMHKPTAQITYNETMEEVVEKFDKSGDWNLPVVDANAKYVGFLSKSKIFTKYRKLLQREAYEDEHIIK